MTRIDRDRLVEARCRLDETPEPQQQVAAVKVRLGEIRLHDDQVVEASQSLIRPLQRAQHDAQVAPSLGRSRINQESPPEQALRRRGIAGLVLADAEPA